MRKLSPLWSIVATLALLVAACGDDSPGEPDVDASVDAAPADAEVTADAAPDGGGDTCADLLTTDVTFEIDSQGPDTQIHASAAFDGQGVWVAYNLPDANGYFDVWAVRLGCDGDPLWGPARISTTDHNETDPVVAVGDDTVYFAWHADNNTGIDNMDILVRTYELDGTPIMASDQILETTRDGTPVTGNAMAPDVAVLPNGQFAVTGVRGLADATAFQVFVQRLNDDGTLDGEALDAAFEPAVSQIYPSIAALPDGTLYLAYERAPVGADEEIFHTRFAPGGSTPDPSPPVIAFSGATGTGASYAADPAGAHVYLAFGNGSEVVLTDGAVFGDGPQVTLNAGSHPDFAPLVVATDGGGAVFWYLNVSGLSNSYYAAPFSYDGATFAAGDPVELTTSTVAPYAPAATHVSGNVYFAAWSEGTSPAFRLMGRFVTVE